MKQKYISSKSNQVPDTVLSILYVLSHGIHTNRSRMEAKLNHTAIHSANEIGSKK